MANIKNLFEKNRSGGVLANTTLKKVGDTVESGDYVESNLEEKNRFVPYIDFASASNFARYGSAEKYYSDSIGYIANEYPYDGSLKEKINWNLSASYLDLHIFENEYPRTNGYILLGKTYGTAVTDVGGYDTFATNEQEYIYLQGSPHPSTGSGDLRNHWDEYNRYNTSSLGKYNLEIDGDNGLTLEFWLNKEDYSSANESSKEVVFDLWNSGTFGNSDYGRFRVELTGGATTDVLEPIFNIELRSGSAGFSYRSDTTGPHSTTVALSSSTPFTGSWNHFALSFQNTGSNMLGRLYRNGKLEHSLITGSSINSVTGAMVSTIGSLMTSVSGTYGAQGAAKLSASLDDFRYWRRIRPSDKIAKYWFVPVGGGTNTDFTNAATASTKYSYENPLDLGVYYKFNEGIMNSASTDSQDSVILDYSGRTTNGSWTGYSVGSRFTGSAMVLSNAAKSEFKDPIIYTSNPSVSSLLTTKTAEGLIHDQQNNASIYHSFPAWIVEEDEDRGRDTLKNLTQIMGSYFDTLQLQIEALPKIKNVKYPSGSNKPYPFANRLVNNLGLVSSEVFENANALEFLASRDDHRTYAKKLNETKNIIYQNMYNNLIYIFKSKGTEKSFRNLIRCYGIDEELVKLSLYGNDVEYELRNNGDNRIIKKRYADFNKSTRFNSTVFQQTSSTNSNSREFISSSSEVLFRGNTYEAEVIFPNKLNFDSVYYVENDFTVASLYGCHTSGTAGAWATSDVGNFQVQSVRPRIDSTEAYFRLTGSAGGYFPLLTSSLFKDVYSDSKWNFAVKIKPSKYPLAAGVTGSATGSYDIEFSGYNYVLDILVNSFETSASISSANAGAFLTANKRFFLGAHRQDFIGATLQKADSKISSLRVWLDYLKSGTIKAHAKDAENFGSEYPYKNAYISQLSKSLGDNVVQIPQIETLAMDWNFDTVTSSNASGQFSVPDFSSGSTALTSRWGWLGPITQYQHTGLGYDFEASDTGSIDRRYVHSVKQQPPETLNSSDMVSLIDDTTRQIFSRDSRPIDYYFAFEKSMYGIVSEQMLNYFATIIAFNNLIGEPVNRYRQNYKDMEKLRSLYFERVENTPDFEKFVEYFKWIDSSLGTMLMQLAPASSGFSQKLRNVIESHVLERNKYWTKFPTLESKASDPEAGLKGINELLYSGKRGIAPIPTTATGSDCEWWLDRANRDNPNITSGDATVDSQRDTIRLANDFRSGSGPTLAVSRDSTSTTTTYTGQAYALRNFTKTYKLTVDESPEIHGGSNFAKNKTVEYTHESLKFNGSDTLSVAASSVEGEKSCTDVIIPESKDKLEYKLENSSDTEGYISGKGNIFAPFSLFSSSVTGGYVSDVATNFRTKTEIDNYHDDIYGDDKGIPVQGPFTEAHVGGRQHRHVNINTASTDTSLTRPEAWDLSVASNTLTISHRSADQPRATMLRDAYAKRPVNIANIKWGTGSQVAGNYQIDYQMLQTSGRKLNNRFFVKNEGFLPVVSSSAFISGVVDYALPRYDLTGTNKYIFVERFNAPGGPDVSSRGSMDINAEEYSVYNELNQRNSIVRDALQSWQTDHCGQFGILSVSGSTQGYRQPRWQDYGTLANYHKVNKNAGMPYLWAKDFSREVEWINGNAIIFSDFNKTLTGIPGTSEYESYAISNQKLENGDSMEIEVVSVASGGDIDVRWAFGISSNHEQPDWTSTPQTLWDFSFYSSWSGAYPYAVAWEKNVQVGSTFEIAVGDRLRIRRDKETVIFEHKPVGANNWIEVGPNPGFGCGGFGFCANGSYYPRVAFGASGSYSIKNARISNPQYDNWYVQHAIPQSELQYAWINDSYDKSKDQPFGYASNYSVPSGSTSTTASAVQFVSASDFGSFILEPPIFLAGYRAWGSNSAGNQFIPTDFAGLNLNIYEPVSSSTNNLGYPLGTSFMAPLAAPAYLNRTFVPVSSLISSLNGSSEYGLYTILLHRNGPYGYPSWKQIRTGETPVARYHKNNNILSVMSPPNPAGINLANGGGTGNAINYYNSRSDDFKNFIQPPVEFKYRPLDTVNATNGTTVTLRSTYGNNTCLFSEGPSNDGTAASSSIYNFLKMDAYKNEIQIYDRMLADEELNTGLASTQYREIIYPRSTNTGLAQTRGRTKYAEVADTVEGTFGLPPTASTFAILSNGPNGIDRGPIDRRTFWRDSEVLRNRTAGYSSSSFDWIYWKKQTPSTTSTQMWQEPGDSLPVTGTWFITGTLPNSQGHYDGCATSIYGLGRTPIVWDFSYYLRFYNNTQASLGSAIWTYIESPGWFYSGSILVNGTVPGGSSPWHFTSSFQVTRSFASPLDFPDRGELNSANYQTIAGYAGTAISSSSPLFKPGYNCTFYPTSSAYYYHLPWFNTRFLTGSDVLLSDSTAECGNVPAVLIPQICDYYARGLGVYGMRWRTEELSGKKAWFDSYEEYAEDIRGVGKSLTIVPQFNISEQMPYYAENFSYNIGDFKKQNDKFLSLPGGNLSSSATEHTQSDGKRGFTEKFFNDYSNSDFQKYFETFQTDGFANSEDEISLKCNVVKKLLPYQGFYPHQRSLQLASLFSQSLGPYISGLSWSAGLASAAGAEYSGALAVQSALQPYFAPGILHNTIKSGLACDWAAYTGSALSQNNNISSGSFINQSSNYRIPFESILDPLGDVGFPDETFNVGGDNEGQNLHLLYPTYQSGSYDGLNPSISIGGVPIYYTPIWSSGSNITSVYSFENSRKPFVRITNDDRATAKQDKAYSLYQMAMSNFLAEIPNFFLQSDEFGNSLTTFVSKEENKITVTSGSTYYMDIVLSKGGGLVLWEDYFNSSSANLALDSADDASNPNRTIMGRGIDGHSFGPPVQSGKIDYMNQAIELPLAPAYAPYTPPYYYGKSIARIKYIAGVSSFTWDDFFAQATVEYSNPDLDATFQVLTSSVFSHSNPAPASASMMTLSSSLNIFGLASVKDVQYGEGGQVLGVSDAPGTRNNRWVISTKMETPVLNFRNSTPREFGYSRGMWGGYGESGIASVAADSIQLEIKESFPSAPEGAPAGYDKYENNFLKKAFNQTTFGNRKTIGAINNDGKEISEAIVAIPYLDYKVGNNRLGPGQLAHTIKKPIIGRYFFSLGGDSRDPSKSSWNIFDNIKNNLQEKGVAVTAEYAQELKLSSEVIASTSISEMIEKMENYVIPPELDFNTFSRDKKHLNKRSGQTGTIEPFAMYIFEFTHQLNKQDLTDIWQGLMPKISTTAELDSETLTHPRTKWVEFFGNRQIPKDVRWMVFKVKKKANRNYYKMTADTKDDQNFADNPFTVGEGEIPYSYNWPYDYCSLIELADLEAGTKFKKKK